MSDLLRWREGVCWMPGCASPVWHHISTGSMPWDHYCSEECGRGHWRLVEPRQERQLSLLEAP
jgi:hypothetical protein